MPMRIGTSSSSGKDSNEKISRSVTHAGPFGEGVLIHSLNAFTEDIH